MENISKIRIGDETYNVKDARIVSGTTDSEFTLEGSLILLCLRQINGGASDADMFLNELRLTTGGSGASVEMTETTMTIQTWGDNMSYIAIIKD